MASARSPRPAEPVSDPSSLYLLTEAAERTGLTVDALRKRIRRGKLETVKGNDGLVRVRITSADMEALRLADGQPGQPKPIHPDENDQTIKVLEAERDAARLAEAKAEGLAEALRDALGRERERADRVEADRDAARALADRRGREVVELRERVGQAEGESGAFREQVKAERDRADQAEARAGRVEAERDAARTEREAAKVAAAAAEGEAKGLRLALEEARRPFWRRWLGS